MFAAVRTAGEEKRQETCKNACRRPGTRMGKCRGPAESSAQEHLRIRPCKPARSYRPGMKYSESYKYSFPVISLRVSGRRAAKNDLAALLTLALWPHGEYETIPRNLYLSSRAPLAKARLPARYRADSFPVFSVSLVDRSSSELHRRSQKPRVVRGVVSVLRTFPELKYGVPSMARRAFGV